MKKKTSLAKIFRFLKPYTGYFVFLLVISVIIGVLESLQVAILYPILDGTLGLQSGTSGNFFLNIINSIAKILPIADIIIANAVIFMIISVLFFAFKILHLLVSLRTTSRVVTDSKLKLFQKFLKSDYQFFVDSKQGELLYKTSTASVSIANLLDDMTKLAVEIIMSISIFVLLFSLSWQGATAVIVVGGLYFYFTRYLSSKISYRSADMKRQASEKENVIVTEFVMGVKPIRVFGTSLYWLKQYAGTVNKFWAFWRRGNFWLQAPMDLINLVLFVAIAIVAILIRVRNPEQFVAMIPVFGTFVFAIMKLVPRLSSFGLHQMRITDSLPNFEAVCDVLQDTTYSKIKDGTKTFSGFKSSIEFKKVKFTHKNRGAILHDVSYAIEKNKMTAIVGASGAGKSTIVDLILRLYDVDDGGIYIDGVNIGEYNTASFLERVGFVGQDTFIYNASIAENISFGKNYTMSELEESARLANAYQLIQQLPEKFETKIGDRGLKLSGGEKQRIAIARAMIRKPEIMVLDEATSSLDNISENLVQKAISLVSKRCTTLIIAHRLQTIQNADIIHVLENGRIVESGTHAELIERKGKYWELYNIQKG